MFFRKARGMKTAMAARNLKEAQVAAVLREGTQSYNFLADTVPLIIWTARADGGVDYFNKAWIDYTGISLAQAREWGWEAVLHPDDAQACIERWRHSLSTGENYEIEYRLKRASDGAYRWFLGRGSARRNTDGEVVQWVGTCTDIDDQKRTAMELSRAHAELENRVAQRTAELAATNQMLLRQQSELAQDITERKQAEADRDRLAAIIEATTDLIGMSDPDGRLIYMNRAGRAMLGVGHNEDITKTVISDFLPDPASNPMLTEGVPTAIRQGTWKGETFALSRSGRVFPVSQAIQAHEGPDGKIEFLSGIIRDITEGKRGEELLRRTEELYRRAISGAGAVPYAYDYKKRAYLFMGQGIEQLTGYSSQEVTPQLWEEIIEESIMGGETAGLTKDEAAHLVTTGQIRNWQCDMRIKMRDGKSRWISDASVQNVDQEGHAIGSMGILQDITDRKQAEFSALCFSKLGQQLSAATSAAGAFRVIAKVTKDLFGWDAFWIKLYDRGNDSICDAFAIDTIGGREVIEEATDHEKPNDFYQGIIRQGAKLVVRDPDALNFSLPGPAPYGDKSRPSAVLMFVPIRSRGLVVGLLSVQSYTARAYCDRDLKTLQTLADQCGGAFERIWSDEARLQSESQFRVVWNASADGMRLADQDGIVLTVNGVYCRMVGKTKDELENQPLSIIQPREKAQYILEKYKERIHSGVIHSQFEEEVTLWDGRIVWFEISNSLLQRPGEPSLVLSIFRDTTDRKREQAELENLHKQLMEASRRAGMAEIATNVLHNVGNVLNSLNISTGLVAESVRKSKASSLARVAALLQEHAHDLGTFITDDARGKHVPAHLAQLSEHLQAEQAANLAELDLLRHNVEHIKEIVAMQQSYATFGGVREMLDVVTLVEDSMRLNEAALRRHEVEVVCEFEKVPLMNLDKHKILQILVNLLRNAKYACDDSGRTDKRLTVRVANVEGRVRISVIDNGIGIPPENLTRIFSHGFTTRKDGHGFGLHSGALAAREMGGSLTAHSDGPGQGATFTLELPLPDSQIQP